MKRTTPLSLALALAVLATRAEAYSVVQSTIVSSGGATSGALPTNTSTDVWIGIQCDNSVWYRLGVGSVTAATSTNGQGVGSQVFHPFQRGAFDQISITPQLGFATTCRISLTTEKSDSLGSTSTITSANAAGTTLEWLVLTSSTTLSVSGGYKSIEFQNLGANSIFCSIGGGTPVVNLARRILPGEQWSLDITDSIAVKCIAATASQVTTAATIVTAVR